MQTHSKPTRTIAIIAIAGLMASSASAQSYSVIRLDLLLRTDPTQNVLGTSVGYGTNHLPRLSNRGDVLNVYRVARDPERLEYQRFDRVVLELPSFSSAPLNKNDRQYMSQGGSAGASRLRVPSSEVFSFNHARLLNPINGALTEPLTPKGITLLPSMSFVGTAVALSVDGIANNSSGMLAGYLYYRTELFSFPGSTLDFQRPGLYNLNNNTVQFLFGPGSTVKLNASDLTIPAVMNDNGVIAGYSGSTPAILSTNPAQTATMFVPPSISVATVGIFDISARGTIIASSTEGAAMSWTSTGSINSLDLSSAQYFGINDRFYIVGSKNGQPGIFRPGSFHAVNAASIGAYAATINHLWDINNNGRMIATVTIPGSGTELAMVQEIGAPYEYQRGDLAGAGRSNILWRHASNTQLGVWFMNNTSVTFESWSFLPACDANWDLVATGDFNSDTFADLVWRNKNTGANGIWLMNGTNFIGYTALPPQADSSWRIVGAADFNQDGQVDIVWRNSATGDNGVWFMNGSTYQGWSFMPATDTGWNVVGTNDMNGDGKPDLVFRNPTTGGNAVWLMNGVAFTGFVGLPAIADTNWRIAAVADMNNDSKADIVWRNIGNGSNGVWIMNGTAYQQWLGLPPAAIDWYMRN